jgi:hypothetical protein
MTSVVSTPAAPGVEEIRFIFPAPPPIEPIIERQNGVDTSGKTYNVDPNKEFTFISNTFDMKERNMFNKHS